MKLVEDCRELAKMEPNNIVSFIFLEIRDLAGTWELCPKLGFWTKKKCNRKLVKNHLRKIELIFTFYFIIFEKSF